MFSAKEYISFGDCDPAGIMFFSRAFEKAHNAYEKFLFANGLGSYFGQNEVVIPILNASSDFKKPLFAGEEITVNISLLEKKESSFSLFYTILKNNGEIAATVKTVHLCVLKENFAKCNRPEDLDTALIKLID
ncbi:MAG: acyl-CoA thioesterase [Ignavibacteriales bacterium]|jgi:YbgC/YbaW family acyl-CoA thioester hydrolase|nr:acyl-CoA thioesterase [Ignavibacteriales bacterium]MBK8660309.1 acyl-CoA thioesterase [Ignavibacteriales bacterium]